MGAVMVGLMIGFFIMSVFKGRGRRKQTGREINSTLNTGMPSYETALGKKAREIVAAQDAQLRSPPPIHGSARWGNELDAASLCTDKAERLDGGSHTLRMGGLINDDGDTGLDVSASYPGHILTVAATGQGKSATQIVENLLAYRGSVIVLDPKGELYDVTARQRATFGKVFRLAPYAREGEHTDHYNPLDELDVGRELGSRARQLAEMFIVRSGGSEAQFFENEAINLLTAIITLVVEVSRHPKTRHMRSMAEVRRICTLPLLTPSPDGKRPLGQREYFQDVLKGMADSSNPYIAGQGRSFQGYEHKLLSSFLSEINSNMAFFDGHPGFAEVSSKSDFQFSDLNREPTTVYLTIPLKQTNISFRFLRAMIGMAFSALEEQREATTASMLFILDEFAALRDMPFMREAVAQMRSSGAWFWFFVQDVAQLETIYHDAANVFLSQTDHQTFFGAVSDAKTKSFISNNLGTGTFAYRDAQMSWGQSIGINDGQSTGMQSAGFSNGRNVGQNINLGDPVKLTPKQLLTPFEVGTVLGQRRPGETHPSVSVMFSKQANGFPLLLRRRHWKAAATDPTRLSSRTLIPVKT
jgi:type IV secretion system protein VirD4